MSEWWHVSQRGLYWGPISAADVKAGLEDGSIAPGASVWRRGMANWTRARVAFDLPRSTSRARGLTVWRALRLTTATLLAWSGMLAAIIIWEARLAVEADLVALAIVLTWFLAGLTSAAFLWAAFEWVRFSQVLSSRLGEGAGLLKILAGLLTVIGFAAALEVATRDPPPPPESQPQVAPAPHPAG